MIQTAGELKKALENIDDDELITVYWEFVENQPTGILSVEKIDFSGVVGLEIHVGIHEE